MEGDAHDCGLAPHDLEVRRGGGAIGERDASTESIQVTGQGHVLEGRVVHPRHVVPRMGESVRQLTIRGEEQEPLAVVVESPDVMQIRRRGCPGLAEDVVDRAAAPFVARRDHDARRLVEEQGDLGGREVERPSVNGDALVSRVRALTEEGTSTINRDAAIDD